jgi:hypothetical protein
MFKYLSLVKWVNVALSVFLLSACGGGSANKSDPLPITLKTYEVLGGVVKGPLKYAKVRVYRYDSNTTSGYGTLVAEGTTNEVTQITGLEITGALASHYIMAFESTDETIDISTQMAPFISQFDTIVTSSQIQTGQPIYASALSSLALSIAHQKVMSNTPIATAIQESELLVKSLFGLGISADISLFTSPALLIESAETFEQQRDILQLRKAIEVFSTLTYLLKQDLNIGDLTFNELIEAIASDIIDGNFDGVSTNSVALPYNSEQLDIFAIPVGSLLLPNTNNVKVDSLNILIIEEASLLHSEILDTEQLSIGKPFNNFNHLSFVVDLDNDGIANSEDSDDDNDGTFDDIDVFPVDGNEWADNDLDGIGNNADDDDDNDTVPDNEDDFPLDKSESEDFDADGIGNNADPDDDNDDVIDENDVFPFDSSESVDTDNDGLGNNQDLDDDNDDILDEFDVFPLDQNESLDSDNDGIGNNADLDDDNDGTFDKEDVFPLDATESLDTDQDSVGNNKDTDDDNDGVADGLDSFPLDVTEQSDTDADGIGNNADLDDDNDGEPDISDVFPFDPSEISDNDSDGIGDIKDTDDDNDGVLDTDDAMPFDPTESVDSDLDGIGNNDDDDDDNDSVTDNEDAFPFDKSESEDFDADGIGNNADPDDDNDDVIDENDVFPFDSSESVDTDNDGLGNNQDLDDDNDDILDEFDVFPLDQNESLDSDNDGIGNNADLDDDNDGTFDKEDVFPLDATESLDTDQDSVGNNKDTDDDNDGVADGLDSFPLDVTEQSDTDADGIGNNADLDDDNDGEPDISDVFPFDPSEISDNDSDGIGDIKDTDDDNDGVLDTDDAMPFDPTESVDSDLDEIGNNADLDDDNDNVLDTDDAFPLDINEWVDTDEDGIGNNADSDDDNDGTYDNDDELPLDATETLDFDKDTIGDIADPDDDNDGIADNLDNIHVAVPSQLQFEPETVINFSIRGLYTDGSILSGNDGWHIQYQVSDVNFAEEQIPFYSENGFYNATFNQAKNEWEVRFPVPDYSGEFEVRFSLYCSASSSICGDHDDSQNYFQREQTVSFLVNCADSSCGYQPESEPGINISASKVLDSLSASLVRNNGDIVATYIDQAENNWKNYVVKSSNDGRSWERIGQLPSFVFDAHIIELAQTSELLLIAKCGSKICLYSSTEGTIWAKQELSTTSIFANCNAETCDINSLSISDFIEADDGALSVFYTKHEDNKNLTYVSKSYDKVNWSTPINMFGSEYTTNIHSIITISDGSFAAAVISYEDYLTTIYISEDGNEWSPIESFSFIDSAKLVYKNSMLRLFYQKDFAIFEAYSDDLISFSTPNKLVDKSYAGFDAFALSNGDFGVIYNLYLNYQYDVFYEGFNLTTP